VSSRFCGQGSGEGVTTGSDYIDIAAFYTKMNENSRQY
jgi:hypothetical protein